MRLSTDECTVRLERARFGVLGTVDPDLGTHLVPVVFVTQDQELIVPVDTVKQKSSTRLRRIENLETDPRSTLLVDHRSPDWSDLWWVRADLRFATQDTPTPSDTTRFAAKYPDYASTDSIESILRFTITGLRGWSASPERT